MRDPHDEPAMLRTAELIAHLDRVVAEARKVGGEFCRMDIDAANAMLDRAETTRDADARRRNLANARRAFEVVSSLHERLKLEAEQDGKVRAGLDLLRERLRNQGAQ